MGTDRGKRQAAPDSSGRIFKILSHPLRQQILAELNEMEEGSPTQLADRLGQRVGNVSYHVKVLAEGNAIELVRTEPRRGALEHFYRPRARTSHVSRTILHLDDEGQGAVNDLLERTAARLDEIEVEVQARSRADGTGTELPESEVAILHFEDGPDDSGEPS